MKHTVPWNTVAANVSNKKSLVHLINIAWDLNENLKQVQQLGRDQLKKVQTTEKPNEQNCNEECDTTINLKKKQENVNTSQNELSVVIIGRQIR